MAEHDPPEFREFPSSETSVGTIHEFLSQKSDEEARKWLDEHPEQRAKLEEHFAELMDNLRELRNLHHPPPMNDLDLLTRDIPDV